MNTISPWMPTIRPEANNFLMASGMVGVVQGLTFGPMSGGGKKHIINPTVFLTGGGANLTGGGQNLTGGDD